MKTDRQSASGGSDATFHVARGRMWDFTSLGFSVVAIPCFISSSICVQNYLRF